MDAHAWDPERYERFETERSQPFFDLLEGVAPTSGGTALDLGCGTGKLTVRLHQHARVATTLGIDRSESMLAEAPTNDALEFRLQAIERFEPAAPFDIVFSNAALQWLPDHRTLIPKVASWVAPGGQLAVQMPANQHHISHVVARDLAENEFGIDPRGTSVLRPDDYAAMLLREGFSEPVVRLNIYIHKLAGREAVIEWVAGTMLNAYRSRLSEPEFLRFSELHRNALLDALPDDRPYHFTFPRILIWARKS